MREARDWFFAFSPDDMQDVIRAVTGPHNACFRMATSYWDMAASFVVNGAIDEQMFNTANVEHVAVFAEVEPPLPATRITSAVSIRW
ncbi:MAG TPA: hypothetical protein VFD58_08955 [Blastocatellia bacterium]|nr:hypothetical protein [Blastocatellia bacterium]